MTNQLTEVFWKAAGTMSRELTKIRLRFRRKIPPWKAEIASLYELSNTDFISETHLVFALTSSNNRDFYFFLKL